jgi:NNP family nitrate/nitrite transporter-like MFS transporter
MMSPFRSHIPALLLLAGIFFINFLSRIVMAPLLPTVEGDLHINHGEAGSFFLFISLGYFVGLLVSGFISARLTHRWTIVISSAAIGASLLVVALTHTMGGIHGGLLMLGFAAGLYLPSGIAAITSLVGFRDWGKAVAIHELAPNIGFVAAPLVAEGLLHWFSWKYIMGLLGFVAILVAVVFMRVGKGGRFPGEAPHPTAIKNLLSLPSFWIMMALFSLGIGASMGVYTMLPLYLVAEQKFEQSWANELVAFSRMAGPAVAFVSGWVTDSLGSKRAMTGVFVLTGMATLLIGMTTGSWLIPFLFLQPTLAICFFPAGFAALANIGPAALRNVAVSFVVPVAFLVGGGLLPTGLGMMGDHGSFALGIMLFGVLLAGGSVLPRYLRLHEEQGK